MKVSIIIPVYNTEKYLAQCLNSVLSQTLQDIEIICVNDCSSDNSLSILTDYEQKDRRIKIINKKANEGVSMARNSGIDYAQGEFMYFIDSDDWIDNDYLEKMIDAIETKDTDIVVASDVITEKATAGIKYIHPSFKDEYLNSYVDYKNAIQNLMVNPWNKLFKKSFIDKYKLRFPKDCNIGEDLYFHYTSIIHTDKVYVVDGSNYHYRSTKNGLSQKETSKDIKNMQIYDLIFDYFKENNLLEKGVKIFSVMPFYQVNTKEKYDIYKKYFEKVNAYLFSHKDIYNDLDLFFAKNMIETKNYEEYKSKFPTNVTISYLRRKK